MKRFLLVLVGLFFIGILIYFVPPLHTKAVQVLTYSECDSPLGYRLGSIDSRFGLSKEEILQDIQSATNIWSTAEGKTLFTYSPNSQLTVNFVYDQRQALDSSISQLNSQLSQKDQTLRQQITQYEAKVASFKDRLTAFRQEVAKYNAQGGAPEPIYDQLIQEQKDLQQEGNTLNDEAKQLNLSTNDYNSGVSVLNNDISQFHDVLNQKPEEGLYNGTNNTITIYIVDNHNELIHTLTHELGHALGMDHVGDKNAIMYPFTTSATAVTQSDMQELSYVCRNQSSIVHYLQAFDLWLFMQLQTLRKYIGK